jgi:hypothetical protein
MDANPVNKDEMAERLQDLREVFGKSLAPLRSRAPQVNSCWYDPQPGNADAEKAGWRHPA